MLTEPLRRKVDHLAQRAGVRTLLKQFTVGMTKRRRNRLDIGGEAAPGGGAHEAEESVAAVAAAGHLGAAADLSPGDVQADVALGAIGVERDLRAVEHGQQFRLVGVQACKQAVESGKAGASSEDAIEADAQLDTRIYPCGLSGWLELDLDTALLAV